MANEFRHESTAAGTSCSQADWEDTDIHRFQGQAQGDIAYASTNTQISRLAIGTTGQVLEVSGGLPSWAAKGFSSRARAGQVATDQHIKKNTWVRVLLEAESYDGDGEFDNRTLSGQADATEAFKLHDNAVGFVAGDVGAAIWNTTDDTYAIVTGFVDDGELDLDTDIMVNGENYILYRCRFTATNTGYYLVSASCLYDTPEADKAYYCAIWKNGANYAAGIFQAGVATQPFTPQATDIVYMAANDYLDLYTRIATAADDVMTSLTEYAYMSIHRIS